jgi:hypothetical protein
LFLATVAGLVAGALSVSRWYVSVEFSDRYQKLQTLKKNREMPEEELNILAQI